MLPGAYVGNNGRTLRRMKGCEHMVLRSETYVPNRNLNFNKKTKSKLRHDSMDGFQIVTNLMCPKNASLLEASQILHNSY